MKILVSAIEPSSNKYLKSIQHYLNELDKNVEFIGIANKNIIKNPLYKVEDFSVMGISSVIPKIFFFKQAIKDMIELSKDVDAILLIDAPSFNLRIAKGIKEKYPNKPIIYYILPKIWAWNPKRLNLVEQYTSFHISILPFENQFYKNSLYLGNPLLDEYHKHNIDFSTNKYIAFLPGSRKSEIQSLMPIFKEVANNIRKKDKTTKMILVIPQSFSNEYIKTLYKDIQDFSIVNDTKEALSKSKFAFVCSGTATFEASLMGVPFVLVYIPKKIDLFIYNIVNFFKESNLSKIGYIGLANIISYFYNKEPIHKEVFKNVSAKKLLDIYNTFDYKQHHENINTLYNIVKIKDDSKNQNSLKSLSIFINNVITNEL
jgi:lipid-A-disaccharide synthase